MSEHENSVTDAVAFTPTPEQQAAIDHGPTPLLIVAGAGTGKTTVMAERMLRFVTDGDARPDQLLGLTFTNKAAGHLKQTVNDRLGPDSDVTVTTYHAFGAALVADHLVELGLAPHVRVLNRAQAWQLLFSVFDQFRFERRKTFKPSLIVDDALLLASRCADHLVPIEAVAADCADLIAKVRWKKAKETAESRQELCQVVEAYEERKRARALIDYGDQLALAVRLLRENPELADGLRQQFPFVLLDEYQDTNYAQRVLLQLVYPPGSCITAVGDDMQSIYAFRGAHLGNIMSFPDHWPPATELPLEINRRSGPQLVALANRIQAQVPDALDKQLTSLDDAPPTTIECFLAADDAAEAAEIARDIEAQGGPWSRHAVLCRKRRLISAIVAALEALDLPVDVVGAGGLLDRPETVDLVAWLELLAHPGATVPLLRILQGPRYRIGFRDVAALARHARSTRAEGAKPELGSALDDIDAVAQLSPAARTRLAALAAERRELSAAARRLSVLDLCELVSTRTGLWAATGDKGRENLLRFFELAARFAPVDGDPGLTAFVEYLQLLDETEEELAEAHPSDAEAIRVMTVHQAKGLEFDCVWVPGLAGGSGRGGGIFPDSRGGENPMSQSASLPWWLREESGGMPEWRTVTRATDIDDEVRRRALDEEWRLFYVATTRARRRLVCSAAHWYPGPADPQGPSRFYEFVAAQTDLVTERFRQEPAAIDPASAARERRRAVAAARLGRPVSRDDAPQLFDEASLPAVTGAEARPAPTAVSVTSLVSYSRCPRQFYWSDVRPLPRMPSAAAALGTSVHRWIEQRAGRALSLFEPEPDLPASTGVVAGLQDAFLSTPYAGLEPAKVEAPFLLVVDGRIVRGRVDAAYERDGRFEVVDFKTGRTPAEGDPGANAQLDLYAVAAVDAWGVDGEKLRTTYCYLRSDGSAQLVERDWTAAEVDAVRTRLGLTLSRIGMAQYPVQPGAWCERCDFLAFCREGQATLG
ncbi:MAG: ATP-dependent helicase UvrD/PcrA [Actinomycetota bacterium]